MKFELLATAMAFASGTLASPEEMGNMENMSVNVEAMTEQQLNAMSDQQTQTLCVFKQKLCCGLHKRDEAGAEAGNTAEAGTAADAANGAATLCKLCKLKGIIDCDDGGGRGPKPCRKGDRRPRCRPTPPEPCRPGDRRPGCPRPPPPCRQGDRRPECPQPPQPCRPGDRRPGCPRPPPPCRPGDRRPGCPQPDRDCEENDSRPECSGGPGPYPG